MARRSPARFLAPLALVGFVVALFLVVNGTRDDAGSGGAGATPAASASPTPGKKQKARKVREDLHGQAGRHAVRHRREDRRAALADPGAQPQPRRPDAVRRAEDQAAPVSPRVLGGAARRRADARRRAGRARRRARRPSVTAPSAHRHRGLDRRRRVRQAARPPARDRLDDEADDRAADARAQPARRPSTAPSATARCPPSRRSSCGRARR